MIVETTVGESDGIIVGKNDGRSVGFPEPSMTEDSTLGEESGRLVIGFSEDVEDGCTIDGEYDGIFVR